MKKKIDNMKRITISYDIRKTIELDVSKFSPTDKKFIKTFYKDEDDRTDEDWDFLEEYSWYDVIGNATGEDESLMSEIEIEDFE